MLRIKFFYIFPLLWSLTTFVGCETTGEDFQNGYNTTVNQYGDPRVRGDMDRLTNNGRTLPSSRELASAIDPSADCTACSQRRNAGRGAGFLSWEEYVSQSNRTGSFFDGPLGRVEFYNSSALSLPGGAGYTTHGVARHLDRTILDVIPLIAGAHQAHGQPMRVSHTTGGRHSSNSLHYSGRAIDIDPQPASRKVAIAREIRDRLAASGGGCGYFVLVESSHIHVSYKGEGRSGGCPGFSQ